MGLETAKLSPLEQYAEEVKQAAALITQWCHETGRPQLSFDSNASSVKIPEDAPENVFRARQTIISSSIKLQNLAMEPRDYVPNLATYFQNLECVRWLCHFNVISKVPSEGSISYDQLASEAGVPLTQLKSIARMAMFSNFLSEPTPGKVAHSSVSRLFIEDPSMVEWVLYMAEHSAPGAAQMTKATTKWGNTVKKNETAVNLHWKTDVPFFDYLATQPELRARFAGLMKNFSKSPATKVDHLVKGYDWKSLGGGKVVDVGGSTCHVSVALANAFPDLKFLVEDLPDTIKHSPDKLELLDNSIKSRIDLKAYDFFTPQPVLDGDVYLLRTILHDWPDVEAVKIIRNQLPALKAKSSARLVVMDTVIPEPGSIPAHEEAWMRVRDLTMHQAFNAKERDLAEWTALMHKAVAEDNANNSCNGEIVLKSHVHPPGSVMSILEFAYETTRRSTEVNGHS